MVIVDANTVRVSGSFVEPIVDADGGALEDLTSTTLHYTLNNGTPVKVNRAASGVSGGGTVNVSVDIPLALSERVRFEAWVTATDAAGLESVPSDSVVLNLDRVAPGAPTNFSIA